MRDEDQDKSLESRMMRWVKINRLTDDEVDEYKRKSIDSWMMRWMNIKESQ
jgi:hypothetical protein